MTVSLLVFSSLLILNQLSIFSAQNLKDKVDVSLFFDKEVPDAKIAEMKTEFEQLEEVKSVRYISAEQALEDFKSNHADDPLIEQSLQLLETNPLQAALVVTARELDLYPVVMQKIQHSRFQPLIQKINYEDSQGLIQTLDKITIGLRTFGILLACVFGFVAVLVMFNTLRLTIFSRREEIEIMRLVGASNRYIRGPYLVEGLLYGLMGSLLAGLLLYPALALSLPYVRYFFGIELPQDSYFRGGFALLILIQSLVGAVLGMVSSIIATKRHLRI